MPTARPPPAVELEIATFQLRWSLLLDGASCNEEWRCPVDPCGPTTGPVGRGRLPVDADELGTATLAPRAADPSAEA